MDNSNKYATCMGINEYPNPKHNLRGCVNDAQRWAKFFLSLNFMVEVYLNEQVIRELVLARLRHFAPIVKRDDIVAFQMSSHGTFLRDISGDEVDGYDEAWVVYDGYILDDEIREILDTYPEGVHIIFISDTCHSHTMTRSGVSLNEDNYCRAKFIELEALPSHPIKLKSTLRSYSKLKGVMMAACLDSESAYDAYIGGRYHGVFSHYCLQILEKNPNLLYSELKGRLGNYLPSLAFPQSPQIDVEDLFKNSVMFSNEKKYLTELSDVKKLTIFQRIINFIVSLLKDLFT